MRFLYRESIAETVESYFKSSVSVEDGDENYYVKALREEKPLPLRKFVLSKIENYRNEVVRAFVIQHGEAYVLPLCDMVAIRGFELRASKSKDFRFIGDGFPAFYGFNHFSQFKYGNLAFIVEGVKDARALGEEYPYVIAALGVTMSRDIIDQLFKLTNRWVFVHDNDWWGRRSAKRLQKSGVVSISTPFSKDLGSLYEGDSEIREYIKSLVKVHLWF